MAQKMKLKKYLPLFLVAVIFLIIIFQKQLSTHLKIALFITEEFPQIPLKPLGLLTRSPIRRLVELRSINGKIVGDLFISEGRDKKSALILATGVKLQDKDKVILLHLADTLSRLGYVVFWPRLETLDQGISLPEEPETFIESFKYLENLKEVDKEKISFVGFSVGSSTALVASSDPQISDKVHGLVFFGGYFDVFDYLLSLATQKMVLNGQVIHWNPSQDATNHTKALLEAKGAEDIIKIFDQNTSDEMKAIIFQAPQAELNRLKKYHPKVHIDKFSAEIFILHDKSDSLVPYVESVKLDQALSKRGHKIFLLTDLFEHVQPNKPFTNESILELSKLYGFLYKVFLFL